MDAPNPPHFRLTSAWPAWFRLAAAGAIVLAVIAVYSPSLPGGYLWDDNAHVPREELRSLHGLWRICTEIGATQQYYPLLFSWFWAQCRLWGDWTPGYHAVTIALHGGAALLVMAVARRLLASRGAAWADLGAWLIAAVWALHPVNVESVAWITQQKNTLSGVLYLSSMLMYLKFDDSRRRGTYAWATALFALSLIAKPVTVTLPPALLVILWWQRGSLSWRRDAVPLLPWFGLAFASGLLAAYVEHSVTGAKGDEFALTAAERLVLPGRIVLFYLAKVLWPFDLLFMYPRWTVDAGAWRQWLFTAGAVALVAVAWALRGRSRAPLAGLLFFAGSLFPVLGLFNVYLFRYTFVADHFEYLPCLGIVAVVCGGLALGAARARPGALRRAALGAAVALPVGLGVLSFRQCRMYSDADTIYAETLARNPAAWMMHNNIGIALNDAGRHAEAIVRFERAIEIYPANAELHNNLGVALYGAGRTSEGIAKFREAIAMREGYLEPLDNLINALSESGQHAEAIGWAVRATAIADHEPRFHLGLGLALGAAGRHAEAIAPFEKAAGLNPGLLEAHWGLAASLDALGRRAEAVAPAERALMLAESRRDAQTAAVIRDWLINRRDPGPR